MTVERITIVADDLTGAADAAGAFAVRGLTTLVVLDDRVQLSARVRSVTTESRDLPENAAVLRSHSAIRNLLARQHGGTRPLIYKKIDSMLRGHPVAELLATVEALGIEQAVVAPALPSEGRITAGGRQIVGVTDSGFPSLVELIRASGSRLPVRGTGPGGLASSLATPGIVVVDAATDRDLERIAAIALNANVPLLCGSAGLSRALARVIEPDPGQGNGIRFDQHAGPCLCVVGSRHHAMARQVEFAARAGIEVVRPSAAELQSPGEGLARVTDFVEAALERNRDVIVTTAGVPTTGLQALEVAGRLAEVVGSARIHARAGGLFVSGGDVAAAVCARLDASALWLTGEVYPAIPSGHLANGVLAGLPIVTKAGSFGPPECIVAAVTHLHERGRSTGTRH